MFKIEYVRVDETIGAMTEGSGRLWTTDYLPYAEEIVYALWEKYRDVEKYAQVRVVDVETGQTMSGIYFE